MVGFTFDGKKLKPLEQKSQSKIKPNTVNQASQVALRAQTQDTGHSMPRLDLSKNSDIFNERSKQIAGAWKVKKIVWPSRSGIRGGIIAFIYIKNRLFHHYFKCFSII
jgi:hypothetical protein